MVGQGGSREREGCSSRLHAEHIQVKTLGGATLSAVAFLLMLVLVINELVSFTSRRVEHHLLVDTRCGVPRGCLLAVCNPHPLPAPRHSSAYYSQGDRDVEIRFDVVFHLLKCAELDIKVEDSKGMQYDPSHIVAHKVPMLGGVEAVANSASADGCRMYGVLGVKKVCDEGGKGTGTLPGHSPRRSLRDVAPGGGQLSHHWRGEACDAHV